MKRAHPILLILLAVALCACTGCSLLRAILTQAAEAEATTPPASDAPIAAETETPAPEATDAPTETPTEAPTPEPTPPPQATPFDFEADVRPWLTASGLVTVGDFVDLVRPTWYMWAYEGDATGNMWLTMYCSDVDDNVSLLFYTGDAGIGGELEGMGGDPLPADILAAECWLAGIDWVSDGGLPIPYPRGIGIGSTTEQVRAAYLDKGDGVGETLYDLQDVFPFASDDQVMQFVGGLHFGPDSDEALSYGEYIHYVWANVEEDSTWHEYYRLYYWIDGGVVTGVSMSYNSDPE